MLEIKNLSAGYAAKEVLHDVSLNVKSGQITIIIGPNGCGKSTLLKSIGGIIPVKSGQILLDNEDLKSLPQNKFAQKVSYLAQNRQVPDITVGRLVLHGRFPYLSYPRRYRKIDYEITTAAMDKMHILDLADTPLNKLSGGQRQKAYIAMALAQDTQIVLMDEPTTFLDVSCQLQLFRCARALSDAGKHVIMVIHDLCHGLKIADNVILINNGNVCFSGTAKEVCDFGLLSDVFGIQIKRVMVDGEWMYCYKE